MLNEEASLDEHAQIVSNDRKWFIRLTIILASVLLLSIVGIGGYWLGARRQQSSPPHLLTKPKPSWLPSATPVKQLFPTPSTITTTASQTNSTSNWKTFRSKRLGYSLQYPPNMYLREAGNALVYISNFQGDVFGGGEPPDPKYDKGIFLVNIVDSNFKAASVSDYLDGWQEYYRRTGFQPAPPRPLGTVAIDSTQGALRVSYGLSSLLAISLALWNL